MKAAAAFGSVAHAAGAGLCVHCTQMGSFKHASNEVLQEVSAQRTHVSAGHSALQSAAHFEHAQSTVAVNFGFEKQLGLLPPSAS